MQTHFTFKDALHVATSVILSCGPSQVFSLIKGTVDTIKYLSVLNKIQQWNKVNDNLEAFNITAIKESHAFKKLMKNAAEGTSDTMILTLLDNKVQRK